MKFKLHYSDLTELQYILYAWQLGKLQYYKYASHDQSKATMVKKKKNKRN